MHMAKSAKHEHPGGDVPHRHSETDELGTHATGKGTTRSVSTGQEAEPTVELREEELQARKQPVEKGQVRVAKDVVEEQQTLEVPVTREEVTIERRPVGRQPSETPVGQGG